MTDKKTFISQVDIPFVPFNYMIGKYDIFLSENQKLDIVNGRHIERTFVSNRIQNPTVRKQYFNKLVSRYETKL